MSDRERTDSGQFVETVTLEGVLGVFDRVHGPVITSSDVADELECTTEAARQKLTRLYDQGRVDKRKTGRTVVYWRTDNVSSQEGHSSPVNDPEPRENEPPTREPDPLDELEYPGGKDQSECKATIRAARDYLKENDGGTKSEIVAEIMPQYPLGYDSDAALAKIEAGDRYRGAWWRRVVKPGLEALDNVKKPPKGAAKWRYVDDSEQNDETPTGGGIYDPTDEF